jgi:hypothetical protein
MCLLLLLLVCFGFLLILLLVSQLDIEVEVIFVNEKRHPSEWPLLHSDYRLGSSPSLTGLKIAMRRAVKKGAKI